ncbi:hypothetical protein ACFX2F_025620 [Malus domestica]
MHLGFCAATGALAQSHRILAWSFSNSNFSIGDALVTQNLPSLVVSEKSLFSDQKGSSWGLVLPGFWLLGAWVWCFLILVRRKRRKERKGEEDVEKVEDWELEYWPYLIDYKEIHAAKRGISREESDREWRTWENV